jgi:hypothetical protein
MFSATEELGSWGTPDPLWFEVEAADDEEVFFVPWPETKELEWCWRSC